MVLKGILKAIEERENNDEINDYELKLKFKAAKKDDGYQFADMSLAPWTTKENPGITNLQQ